MPLLLGKGGKINMQEKEKCDLNVTEKRLEQWKQECLKERNQRKNLEKENTELIRIIKKLASNGSFSALTLRELRMLEKITK